MKPNSPKPYLKSAIFLLLLALTLLFSSPIQVHAAGTSFVAPSGSDANPGSETQPWKTFFKAASTATAGDTVIFEDGTYNETQTTVVKNSGTATAPIVFKARNLHKAILFYRGISNNWKIDVTGKPYIHIKDFEITQDTKGTTSSDKFINYFGGANFGVVSGNKIHNAFEDLVKIGQTNNILVENNILYDITREAFDQVGGAGTIIRNNTISDFHRFGIMVKGGARNVEVVGNTLKRGNSTTWVVAIQIGGSSDAEFVYNPSGYEGYNIVAYNNVVIAETPGAIAEALNMTGCDTCSYVNNAAIGADLAMTIADGPGKSKGWLVDVHTRNPEFRNNIVMDCVKNAFWAYDAPVGTLKYDYNLIFNCPNPTIPQQAHGVFTDPKFVNKLSDWHLQSSSPAIGKGVTLSPFPTFSDVNTPPSSPISISNDRDNNQRVSPWDIGAYDTDSISSSPSVTPITGDANNDQKVDLIDFNIWRQEFSGIKSTKSSDFNNSGIVDLLDFNLWRNNFI